MLVGANLTKFATEALALGAKALSLTAQTTETRALERMLKDVGDKTAEASRQAGEATGDRHQVGDRDRGQGCRRRQEGHHGC